MDRKDVQTKEDLYLYEMRTSTIDFFVWRGIIFVISVILAINRLWLPLAILFFSYLIGLFSGMSWEEYGTYQQKFREQFANKKK